jgi:hypothetical protein
MPDPADFDNQEKWMNACVPVMVGEGKPQEQAVAACSSMWMMKDDAQKYRMSLIAVKAVGNWELDVTPVPFHSRDSDRQWFDEQTDIMNEVFQTPVVLYQHGVKQGARGLQDKPIILGKTQAGTLRKQHDGWHIRTVLDPNNPHSKEVMDAARKGNVAVSSDSITHLARLDIGGRFIQYEKTRPGRIAVWPLAGFSLWEKGNGNFQPANHMAVAQPTIKAIYREAGLAFPKVNSDTTGDAEAELVRRRAEIRAKAIQILEKTKS